MADSIHAMAMFSIIYQWSKVLRSRRNSGRAYSSSSGSAAECTKCVASASVSVIKPWCLFTISLSLPESIGLGLFNTDQKNKQTNKKNECETHQQSLCQLRAWCKSQAEPGTWLGWVLSLLPSSFQCDGPFWKERQNPCASSRDRYEICFRKIYSNNANACKQIVLLVNSGQNLAETTVGPEI